MSAFAALAIGTILTQGPDVSRAVVSHQKGVPAGVSAAISVPTAAWGSDGALLVVTWGSSSCPAVPDSVHADTAHRLSIVTKASSGSCTADIAATTSVVRLPDRIDDTAPVTVVIDSTTMTLAPR